jgi:hypothetical protein
MQFHLGIPSGHWLLEVWLCSATFFPTGEALK